MNPGMVLIWLMTTCPSVRHEHVKFQQPFSQLPRRSGAASSCYLASQVQELAVRTFEAIGCEGLARVDMFVTHEGQVVINEINTMPGFTQHSMFPHAREHEMS